MRARGIAGRHERREPGREDEDPLVAMDYGYLKLGATKDYDDDDDETTQHKLLILVARAILQSNGEPSINSQDCDVVGITICSFGFYVFFMFPLFSPSNLFTPFHTFFTPFHNFFTFSLFHIFFTLFHTFIFTFDLSLLLLRLRLRLRLRSRSRLRLLSLIVIVNVPPADDEQAARVPKTGEQEEIRAQAK